ncbi:hypothetical protein SARC_00704 [Sphaeroforma arctica JP610]|uniref:ATP-dependent RNA helicase PRP5/DDX46/KHDC4 KH domain-containing protein n=1 Tax=Sphaeroforma arctica JP610 TaxID=667725 RepID=A0A0L0GE74_9EUKA|nr:hypothetical protein SARC_00704 [Sphaeroforma arctica JP610]KNC87176.1 hypothetical protein SARC_00704 [Sphaeroforma arctica JP610]|eukprot:XP_014161078.1 hypothetical protein SARC_00704 [Sphaeroforma arctica JP610]
MSNPAALKAAALAAAKLNERLAAKGLTNVKPHSNVKLPASVQASSASSSLMRDIEVNNVPAMIRLEVTRQAFHNQLQSEFGVSVCTKGRYCEPGTSLPDNERPLYLSLWATEPESLTKAVAKLMGHTQLLPVEALLSQHL